ncbi:hypothetical protein [Nocardioides sp. KR10-350]|uniref:hypothetical protein n=1 Tax=Nocardioides cheoyonin TaxID=3156615 RepID=UPI0032B61BB7
MRGPRLAGLLIVVAVGTTAAGCSSDDDSPHSAASPGAAATPSASASTAPSATPSTTPTASGPTTTPTPTTAPLAWRKIDESAEDTVVTTGRWTLRVPQSGRSFSLDGPGRGEGGQAASRFHFVDALLDDDWAVVVAQDKQETLPQRATVVDLNAKTFKTWTIDGSSDVPTATGGSWALYGDRLVHATLDGRRYCQARVDITSRSSTVGWCAPPRNGWNSPVIGADGEAMLTFDAHHPSCRTVVTVDGATITPFPDVARCKGAQGALLGDGRVWSVVPNEHRYEAVEVYATTADGIADLGPGVNGTLTVCGDAVLWAADPETDNGPARLMRWDGSTLSTAYESGRGAAFLGPPECAGSALTVASFSDSGDEQVTAPVG